MTGGALRFEVRLAGRGISRHDRGGTHPRRVAAVDRETVEERRDVGDLRVGEVELRHLRRPAGAHDAGDRLAVLIVLNELRAEQTRSAVAAARVGAVAELAVHAVERSPAIEDGWIGR